MIFSSDFFIAADGFRYFLSYAFAAAHADAAAAYFLDYFLLSFFAADADIDDYIFFAMLFDYSFRVFFDAAFTLDFIDISAFLRFLIFFHYFLMIISP